MEVWEDYPSLFHYTSEAGVFGILQSQVLHATHYRYLNDTSELLVMKEIMTHMVLPHVREFCCKVMKSPDGVKALEAEGGLQQLIARACNGIVDSIYKVTLGEGYPQAHFRPHIVSFCGHEQESYEWQHGLLSQWRAYGGASGYALVFDTKALWEMAKEEHARHHYDPPLQLCDVIYSNAAEEIEAEFGDLRRAIDRMAPNSLLGKYEVPSEFYRHVVTCLPRLKHRAFREESEVRLILSPTDPSRLAKLEARKTAGGKEVVDRPVKEVCFRNAFTPYIKLFEGSKIGLPIQRIIVGPHREKALKCERLRDYLKVTDRTILVDCSDTPLV